MELIKIVIMVAITLAVSITITMKTIGDHHTEPEQHLRFAKASLVPSNRVSRFLAEDYKNPRAADHCNKDYDACYVHGSNATTCCNNKCIDVHYDDKNCGACKKKCKYTETCCRGQCVNTNYDKRHCGACNNRCETGHYCIYGMCDYSI